MICVTECLKWGRLSLNNSTAMGRVIPPVIDSERFSFDSSINTKSVKAAVIWGPNIPLIIITKAKKAVICPLRFEVATLATATRPSVTNELMKNRYSASKIQHSIKDYIRGASTIAGRARRQASIAALTGPSW